MIKKVNITASIVLYNENLEEVSNVVHCFLNIPESKKLFLIDNSVSNKFHDKYIDPQIEYIFNERNIGFGRGHNVVLNKIENLSKYHLILNPDVSFDSQVISTLAERIKDEDTIAMIAPKVTFRDGVLQYTARKYPSFFELIFRRLKWFKNYTYRKEYRSYDLSEPFFPDFIHGCFMLFRTKDLINVGGFDERFFMYMEDVDICRKIDQMGKKKLYYPKVQITHVLKKGSSKNMKLFYTHFSSMIKYFKKWGFR